MRYKKESIDNLLGIISVVDVVSDKVILKKSGSVFKGLCPFHHEKTPSFIVSPQKNIFKCFGCGIGGDALSFIMNYEKLSYIEAIEYLAQKYNFSLETEGSRPKNDSLSIIYKILDESRKFFRLQLKKEKNKLSLYLNKRGLTDELIDDFSIGYAPDSFDSLYNYLKSMNFSENLMFEAGVITVNKHNKAVDRFINRLIFPIFGENGKTLGFGGRVFNDEDAKRFGKYINSKETKVYHKSEVLYGLNFAKHFINKEKTVIVVEGYLDVIALNGSGIKNTVSASGTAFTDKQIKILKKYANKLILCFDGDSAGEKAAQRMLLPVIKNNINCMVVTLPLNEDPDSYVKKVGKDKFLSYINENEVDITDYYININLKKGISEEDTLKNLLELLSELNEDITLSFILKKLSSRFDIPYKSILSDFNFYKNKKKLENNTKIETIRTFNGVVDKIDKKIKEIQRELLAIFLDFPEFLNMSVIAVFENEEIKKILNLLLEFYYTKLFVNRDSFLDNMKTELSLKEINFLKMLKSKENVFNIPKEYIRNIINDYLINLETEKKRKYMEVLKEEIKKMNKLLLNDKDLESIKKDKKAEIMDIITDIKRIKKNTYV